MYIHISLAAFPRFSDLLGPATLRWKHNLDNLDNPR